MSVKASRKSGLAAERAKAIDDAMDAASAALKAAEKVYGAGGLGGEARFSLAGSAMREAGKQAENAVKTAMAQVAEAMEQIAHHGRADR